MAQRHNVVKGPSKFDLMLALFAKNSDQAVVEFEIEGWNNQILKEPLTKFRKIILTGLVRESGDGENWLISGWYVSGANSWKASGFYSTKLRTGHIDIGY